MAHTGGSTRCAHHIRLAELGEEIIVQTHITGKDIGAVTDASGTQPEALEQYYPALLRYLTQALHGRAYPNAQDLVQDIYLRFLALPHREQVLKPKAYLLRIASNLVMEYRLREQRAPVLFDSELTEHQHAHETGEFWKDALADALSLQQQFEEELGKMPAMQHAVALLWVRDGLTLEQIADKTGLTLQTTRKYLSRALAALRAAGKAP